MKKILKDANPDTSRPETAQQSIPFEEMMKDGICRVKGNYYTKTIEFQDINYQLAEDADKSVIFEEWCRFLNFFDSSIRFELSFVNRHTDEASFEKQITIPLKDDGFDDVREEYSSMLRTQLRQGNSGLTKTKYLTFGIEAKDLKEARSRLRQIELDIMNNFRRLGIAAESLDGKARLKALHGIFHMGDDDRFFFDWKDLVPSGLSVKDYIAPTSFSFPSGRILKMGPLFGAMSFVSITASEMSDKFLRKLLDMDCSGVICTEHVFRDGPAVYKYTR